MTSAFAFAAIYIRREEDFTWLFRALALAAIAMQHRHVEATALQVIA